MVDRFTQAMMKLATVAQDPSKLIDCSEVIPMPNNSPLPPPMLPANKTLGDIQAAVRLVPPSIDHPSARCAMTDEILRSALPRRSRASARPLVSVTRRTCIRSELMSSLCRSRDLRRSRVRIPVHIRVRSSSSLRRSPARPPKAAVLHAPCPPNCFKFFQSACNRRWFL